jgi:predicted HTH transcriptional regulator
MQFDTTPEGLLEIISQGESDNVEFKTKLPPADLIAKILTAFANSQGGILIVGISDKGEIIGLSNNELMNTFIRLQHLTASLFSWPIETNSVNIDGKNIVYVIVDKAPPHLAPIMTAKGAIYTQRSGRLTRLESEEFVKSEIIDFKQTQAKEEYIAFVAMSFRDEEEPALVDYLRAMERAISASELSIKLTRMDLVEGDYEISQQLMDEIDRADIVITDFTLSPANVYFELGYARGRKKRIIQTARKGTLLEFDVRNWRTLFYRNATELEQKLIAELKAAYADVTKSPFQNLIG